MILKNLEPGINFAFRFDCDPITGESKYIYRVVRHGRYGRFYVEMKHPRTTNGLPGELFDCSMLDDREVVIVD